MNRANDIYKKTVRSSGIYGISQFLNAILGAIRSKITAVFIGPEGVGVLGILQSIMDFLRSTTGFGLDTIAVKDIASTEEKSSHEKNVTLYSVKMLYFIAAIVGASICIIFSSPLSRYAFGNSSFQIPIVLMSVTLIFITLTAWIVSTFQGLKQIKYLSYASTLGSLLSYIALIPAYYFWGIKGVVPMFIGTNGIIFLVNFYYYKKLNIKKESIPWREILRRNRESLLFGIYIVVGGFIFSGSILLLKSYINDSGGLKLAGIYQAIWAITSLCWTLILKVTNSFYFPHLCSIIGHKWRNVIYVNQQTLFVGSITLPVILFLALFSKQWLEWLYSSEFTSEHQTLFLHFVGSYLKIFITPLALVMVAKGRGVCFLLTETFFWLIYLVVFFVIYPHLNLLATGIAYIVAYLVYFPIVAMISYKLDRIHLTKKTYFLFCAVFIVLCFYTFIYLQDVQYSFFIQVAIIILCSLIVVYQLNKYFPIRTLFSRKKG